MKHRVLWIEDGAFTELTLMSSPIYVSGKYDLVIALTASEGLQKLLNVSEKPFETIIVDIRLPPGSDEEFIDLFNTQGGGSKVAARLGLALLRRVLKDGEAIGVPLHHRQPQKFGIFTVESRGELEVDLRELGITVCHQKTELLDKNQVMRIIEEIRAQSHEK